MRTTFLSIALTAFAILSVASASASAEEPYQRVTVEELKRIQKQNDEEQKRLDATPEYQAKLRLEEAARQRREHEAFVAKEQEMRLKLQAAELEGKKLANQSLANQNSMSHASSGGSGGVVVVPNVYNNIPRLAVYAHPAHINLHPVVPHVKVVRPVVRPAVRIRR